MKKELFALEETTLKDNDKEILQGFNMHLYEGDVCGIICDSINERDTLLDFFRGDCEVVKGVVRFRHATVKNGSAPQMLGREFSVIEKKSKLLSSLSIMENICIFVDKNNIVRKRKYYELTKKYFRDFGISIQPEKQVALLSEKERVIIELLKAYAENKSVVVLADLTGFLQKNELAEVHHLLLKLQQTGICFILLETLEDIVFSWTNQLLIIKNGKELGCFAPAFVDRQKLYDFLAGKQSGYEKKTEFEQSLEEIEDMDDTVFRMEKVSTKMLQDLTFSVGKGEILKILFANAGDFEGFRRIFMDGSSVVSGTVYLQETVMHCRNIREWRKRGLCYRGEMPHRSMLIQDMTVVDNFMLELAGKVELLWMLPRYRKSVYQYIEDHLGEGMANRRLRNLSPDILQRIQLGKYYLAAPKVLVCEKPFQEVDLHIREVTLEMFAKLRSRGITIIALMTNLSDLNLVEGSNLYIRNGSMVDENEIYQILYTEQEQV